MPAPKTVVFVDYQNVHMSAHELWCGIGDSPKDCIIDPLSLAKRVVGKRAPGGDIVEVRVYRGRPDPRKQPTLAAANDRQAARWSTHPLVTVKRRPLWYPYDWGQPSCTDRPREKGVDVALAIDMVRLAIEKKYEVGILVSRDTDLLPALETVRELQVAHVEIAAWNGASRLKLPGKPKLWCHDLTETDFHAVRDTAEHGSPRT